MGKRLRKPNMKSLIIVYSYHHNNTQKIAEAIASVIPSTIQSPVDFPTEELDGYDLIGFGAGIDSGKHYKQLLNFVEKLPVVTSTKCYLFSTSAIQGEQKVYKDHSALRTILISRGFDVIGEFSCKGFNTNSFLKYFGGMNKNRPNEHDFKDAKRFAQELLL